MNPIFKIVVKTVLLVFCGACLWQIGWWQGFATGADAALCVTAHSKYGADRAMEEQSCRNLQGKTPPPDFFLI